MPETIYNQDFYNHQLAGSHTAASIILPILFKRWMPKTVIDVGGGVGTWCAAAMDCGVAEALTLDGDYVQLDQLRIPENHFRAHDLATRLPQNLASDLAICLEVAEHLSPDRAESFIAELAQLGEVVLFSAAIPYQGGSDHQNENWLEYWAKLFLRSNYVPVDFLRNEIWHDRRIPFWYRQNLIVFTTKQRAQAFFAGVPVANPLALTRIHPEMYLQTVHSSLGATERNFGSDDWNYGKVLSGSATSVSYGGEYEWERKSKPNTTSEVERHDVSALLPLLLVYGQDQQIRSIVLRCLSTHPDVTLVKSHTNSEKIFRPKNLSKLHVFEEIEMITFPVDFASIDMSQRTYPIIEAALISASNSRELSAAVAKNTRLRIIVFPEELPADDPFLSMRDHCGQDQLLVQKASDLLNFPEAFLDGIAKFCWLPANSDWHISSMEILEKARTTIERNGIGG
jgi:hypothetical protein